MNSRHDQRTTVRLPGLDGIRGLAVLMVLFLHLYQDRTSLTGRIAAYGHYGVTIFFVLSGFIITHLLLREESKGAVSLTGFYERRALRILPPLTLFLSALATLTSCGVISVPWSDVAACLFFYRNYFGTSLETAHFWTLSIEEQFYMVWPFLFVVCKAGVPRPGICVAGVLLCRFVNLNGADNPMEPMESLNTLRRIDGLCMGCGFALLADRYQSRLLMSGVSTACALIVLVVCVSELFAIPGIRSLSSVLACACVCVLIYSAAYGNGIWTRFLELLPLRAIGRVSYELYIWQQPFCYGPISLWPLWIRAALIAICTLGSWFFVERPVMAWAKRDVAGAR